METAENLLEKDINGRATPETLTIDVSGVLYRDLNRRLRDAVNQGFSQIELRNVTGQRYIGTDLDGPVRIDIHGTPGNDLGAFMHGPSLVVHGNAQDGCGNTMDDGEIVVHGGAGDIAGLSMRGGRLFIRDSVGYRAGIHMKEYQDKRPLLVIGGTAGDFVGEYMAGGALILLGLSPSSRSRPSEFIGTGMHGGTIYVRGAVEPHQVGKEVGITPLIPEDVDILSDAIGRFSSHFGHDAHQILDAEFAKLIPLSSRPYGRLYAY